MKKDTIVRCEGDFEIMQMPTTKLGTLQKKSPSMFSRWQDRYCSLDSGVFKYYKSNKPKDLKNP